MHFNGDFTEAVGCVKDAITLVRGGDYVSRTLHDHIANAYGQFNALRPDDSNPQPVFSASVNPQTVESCCDALEAELPADTENTPVQFDLGKYWAILQLLLQLGKLIGEKS